MSQREAGADEQEVKSLWSELGLPEPIYRPADQAPEVERDLLVRLSRGELSERNARIIYRLIHSFESWRDAHAEVVVDEYHRKQTSGPGEE